MSLNHTVLKKIGISLSLVFLILASAHPACFAQSDLKIKADSGQSIPDTLLFKIQKAQAAITEINSATKKGYGSVEVRSDLKAVLTSITPIERDLKVSKKVVDSKTLIGYNLILKDSQDKLEKWRTQLASSSNDLQRMSKEVLDLSKDSLLNVNAHDTTAKNLYKSQLIDIKIKLQDAGKATVANLDTVSRLLADVSAVYLRIEEIQSSITDKLKTTGKSLFQKESPYLWSAPKEDTDNDIGNVLSSSYEGQNKILGYFIHSTWDNRILLLLFGGVFFLWVFLNFKKAVKPDVSEKIGALDFKSINRIPLISSLIVLLNLTPLFEPDSPSLYIEVIMFLMLITLSIYLCKRLPKNELMYWFVIVALYIVIVLTNAAVHDGLFMRLWLIALNIGSLYIGVRFYKKLINANVAERFIKPVIIIYLLFNFVSVILNMIGRISLSKIYTTTAVIGLIQIIGLAVFIQIFTDALELQIKVSSCNGGLFSRLDISKTRLSFKKALSTIAVILWLLVFLINLSISGGVFALIHQILSKNRSFGSVTFTLNNILFFGVILYVSNILQKHVDILFGENNIHFTNEVEHKSSKLTLIRLVIAILGVMLAVTASGIPLDKLTVVLGALSVGIGLGMQNIVNNFVSGVILIFEKPFQIGDFIELADKKGKIQDIGIRSSKMLTQQGSQVIIPNGDLISNRFVNWTLNSANVQSEIILKINMSADLKAANEIIEDEIGKSDEAIHSIAPQILINSLAADAIELRILVWINSVYVEPAFKSKLFNQFITRFNQAQIKIM
jgi:small-conductance mechanosensitive channel